MRTRVTKAFKPTSEAEKGRERERGVYTHIPKGSTDLLGPKYCNPNYAYAYTRTGGLPPCVARSDTLLFRNWPLILVQVKRHGVLPMEKGG